MRVYDGLTLLYHGLSACSGDNSRATVRGLSPRSCVRYINAHGDRKTGLNLVYK